MSDAAPSNGPVLAEETVVVPAVAGQLAALHAALARFWQAAGRTLARPPNTAWRLRFETAVAEVGANVVRHAYPAGAAPGPMALRLRAYADRVEARFADQGVAFVPPLQATIGAAATIVETPFAGCGLALAFPAAPPTAPAADLSTLPEGGYGLALVRAAVDELVYARTPGGENQWRLVKRF